MQKASSILHLPASNGQILHSHLESQSLFTIPLLTVRRGHRETLEGSLVPSPGYSKTSHAGNCRTREGKKMKFSQAVAFLAVREDRQNLLPTFPEHTDVHGGLLPLFCF